MQIPEKNCQICPRLADFRAQNQIQYPNFFNGCVPSFGALDAEILVVGLAPGLKGANHTGRPFTGDYAGEILYAGLKTHQLAKGNYAARPDDGFQLINMRITNAVRCVPPANKPEPSEIKACNQFLRAEIAAMPNLRAILTLGTISHYAVLNALDLKRKDFAFKHGAVYELGKGKTLFNSYHCSRYNINTGRLTQAMFDEVVKKIIKII